MDKVQEVITRLDRLDKLWCLKHGTYPVPNDADYHPCPKCLDVSNKDLCVACEQHIASVTFSEGALDWGHGGGYRLCNCCYFKKVEKTYLEVKENYEKLKVEQKPCQ